MKDFPIYATIPTLSGALETCLVINRPLCHVPEQHLRTEQRLFQLEGTYNDHLVQLPDQFRTDQVKACYYKPCPNASSTVTGLGHQPPL